MTFLLIPVEQQTLDIDGLRLTAGPFQPQRSLRQVALAN